jgi:MFS family permease
MSANTFLRAPFFVGVAFLFSGWYTRKELAKRLGIFFSGAMFSGAFGGLFAAGIASAFKNNRIESWRYHSPIYPLRDSMLMTS